MTMLSNQRGITLITSVLVVIVLSILSLALMSRHSIFIQSTERNQNKIVAFNAAEAGVDKAITQLVSNTSYAGVSSFTSLDAAGTQGGYAVTVGNSDENGTAFTSSDYRLITAVGHSPSLAASYSATSCPTTSTGTRGYECREILAYVELDDTAFEYAIFGETSVTFNGASGLIDSYDSSDGAYGGANVFSNGDVAYDGTYTNNNTTINGDIVANPNIACDPGSTTLPSLGALTLNGNHNVTLAAGTYHFSSITVTGNASITCTGAVTIYVDGEVSITGNGITTSGNNPTNLMIVATSDADVTVGGSAAFYGAIYAPDSAVTSNAGEYYGAVISDTFAQNGIGNVHYDEDLGDMPTPCTTVNLLSWREKATAAA